MMARTEPNLIKDASELKSCKKKSENEVSPSNLVWPYLIENQNIVMPGSPEFQPWFESLPIRDKWVVMGALELAAVNSNLIAIYDKAGDSETKSKLLNKSINSDHLNRNSIVNPSVGEQATTSPKTSTVHTLPTVPTTCEPAIKSSGVQVHRPSTKVDGNQKLDGTALTQVSFERLLNDMIIKKVFSCFTQADFAQAWDKLIQDPNRPILVRSKCSRKLQKLIDRHDSVVQTYGPQESAILVRKLQSDHLDDLCQLMTNTLVFESHLPEKLQETAFLVDKVSANEFYGKRCDCHHVESEFSKMFIVGGLLLLAEKAYHIREKIRQHY